MPLTRRQFCSTFAAAPALIHTARAAQERPNIVLILADDLGWGDLGCYNRESKIPTPNLDRFAGQGVRFTDMHSPSSVCTPTRYGILTGRYCWRSRLKNGVLQGYSPNLIEADRPTIASTLKAAGYYTAGVGKWHLGFGNREKTDYEQPLEPGPNAHGFDYYFGIPASLDMPPYLYFENSKPVEKPTASTPGHEGSTGPASGPFWRGGAMAPSFQFDQVMPALTRKAVSIVRERAPAKQPFFLYFPMTGPHTPWMPVAPFRGKSRAGEYGDFVAQIDDAAGQVFHAVDEAGLGKNTLVIFTSDNGAYWWPADIERTGHRANDGWRGLKADVYDAGHRIPFLARWTGRTKPGAVRNDLGFLTDIFATVAEGAGIALPADGAEDSFSQFGAVTGRANMNPARDFVIHHSSQGMFAVRQGSWKLNDGRGSGGFSKPVTITPGPGEPAGELYDLSNDPAETNNLYGSRPEIVARLRELLDAAKSRGRTR
jgi:arylsulfatase A-like enzyme